MSAIPPRTLPASWYCSSPLYQLERRAVFLKAWYLLGPVTKFETGNAVQYEFAQIPLTARRNPGSEDVKDIKVLADSDVCRDPNPKTVPIEEEGFRLELRSHMTRTGLLFTTISDEAPLFDEFFPDLEDTLASVDFTQRPYRHSIQYEGSFNWKTMIDGYQECLHCQYTHPAFSVLYPPTFYSVINHTNWCRHIADPSNPDDGLFLYFFPNCTLNVYGGGMSSFRVCPTASPHTTRMEFDYYHLETGDAFAKYYAFVRQVAQEDFDLCERAQANLEKGIYDEGILNPVNESGVAYYQQRVLDLVLEQYESEKKILREEEVDNKENGTGGSGSTQQQQHAGRDAGGVVCARA